MKKLLFILFPFSVFAQYSTMMLDNNNNIVRPIGFWGLSSTTSNILYIAGGSSSTATNVSSAITNQWKMDATNAAAGSVNQNIILGLTNAFALSTNFIHNDALRVVQGGIHFYGNNRFRWPHVNGTLNTNGPMRLNFAGNGWVTDGDFGNIITNLITYMPFAGFASTMQMNNPVVLSFPTPFVYGPDSGLDTATYYAPEFNPATWSTNWIKSFFILATNGSISSPIVAYSSLVLTTDVASVSYLANPTGGMFYFEMRTNNAASMPFTDLGAQWILLSDVNATNATFVGKTVAYTNSAPVPMQLRVRSHTAGYVPILEWGQWNSWTASNGLVVSSYAYPHGPVLTNVPPNISYPIWAFQKPTATIMPGGFTDSQSAYMMASLNYFKNGYTNCDLIDITTQEYMPTLGTNVLEQQFCYSNNIPFLNGEAATYDAWGSFSNAVSQGYYDVTQLPHLSQQGYTSFAAIVSAWLAWTLEYH